MPVRGERAKKEVAVRKHDVNGPAMGIRFKERCLAVPKSCAISFPGTLLWRSGGPPCFLPWQAVLAQRRRAILARIPKPLCLCFSCIQKATLGTGEILASCFGAENLATSPGFLSLYACFSSIQDPVGGPRFSFTGKLFWRSKGGPFWPPAQNF